MHILSSYQRAVQLILTCSILITSVTQDSFAQGPVKWEKLLHTQKSADLWLPMVRTESNISNKSLVTFTFVDTLTGKTQRRAIQARLLTGIEEIVGGAYQPASNTVVILAYIKNIAEVQMLSIGFQPQYNRQRLARFAIEPVPATMAATIQSAYGSLEVAASRVGTDRHKPLFKWPRLGRPRCKRWKISCIPSPPASSQPSPPQQPVGPPPKPSEPPNQPPPPQPARPCHPCKSVTLVCGEVLRANATYQPEFELSALRVMSQNGNSSLPTCSDSAWVSRTPPPDGCTLCLGNKFWSENALQQGKCGQEISIEAFQTWSQQYIQQLLAPVSDKFQPLTGENLIAAIRAKLISIDEACAMTDEMSHLLRQKACETPKVCDEWQSTDDHLACWNRPDVISIIKDLYAILQDRGRFPSNSDQALQREKLERFKASVCGQVAILGLAEALERCVCCVATERLPLTRKDCEDCVDKACKPSAQPPQGSQFEFCRDVDVSEITNDYCNDVKSGKPEETHNCDNLIGQPSVNQSSPANRSLSAIANRETDREPNCSPPQPPLCCEYNHIGDSSDYEACCRVNNPDWEMGDFCRSCVTS